MKLHAIAIIAILHAVGLTGVLLGHGEFFWSLTPLNLLVSGGLAMRSAWAERTWWWAVVALGGLVAEVVGVSTGWLFGDYAYSGVLGWRVLGVPWLLGWMWLLLLQGSRYGVGGRWMQASFGATLMTAMDVLIEPVAVRAGWWAWAAEQPEWMAWKALVVEGQTIPWWNFASWWLVSFLLLLFAPALPSHASQRVWRGLWWIMVVFFSVLNLTEWN